MNTPPEDLSPLKQARRQKIVLAAESLFRRNGFRGTTMEGVAAEVGMSKVTVYGYFKDKDVLFAAVAAGIAQRVQDVVQAALSAPSSVQDRVTKALVSKHDLVFKLVRQSAFAGELFAAKDQFAAEVFKHADGAIETMITETLEQGGFSEGQSKTYGRLLFGGSTGIANQAKDNAEMVSDIEEFVQVMLKGGRPK